ncbi:MAG TPA: glutaredoxin domain-containing protein [Oxalicibacterium sp.]|uniref:glutaredoxin domain-containing protein n=1 Tax=Oxalicibacterium sp. TaxID=2766525 RepID=UPI002CB1FEFB|nr:glutaredoxin domain-containing protein [Oxalicibacterium sp.]HWU97969.1 glutaredoxin domain-containing protein [Oxalicibacterium sp.]
MSRPLLKQENQTADVQNFIAGYHRQTIEEVTAAIAANRIVVVGMAQNPFVKKARAALNAANTDFRYLEYGSYLSLWKPRLAIKMWSGWPTFPQVFVDGVLIGGYKETVAALQAGTISPK